MLNICPPPEAQKQNKTSDWHLEHSVIDYFFSQAFKELWIFSLKLIYRDFCGQNKTLIKFCNVSNSLQLKFILKRVSRSFVNV